MSLDSSRLQQPKPAILTVGISVLDLVFMTDQLPTEAKKHFAKGLLATAGGPAVNAAKAIAALDGSAALVSVIGNDEFGQMFLTDLAASGVDTTQVMLDETVRTSISSVVVDGQGERQIVNFRDNALVGQTPSAIDITAIDVVLGDLRCQPAVLAAFASAKANNASTVLDADLASELPSDGLLAMTDYCVFSEPALAELTRSASAGAGLEIFQNIYPEMQIAVTCGGSGVCYSSPNTEMDHIPPRKVDVQSTLAAGDVFHGAFALAIASGLDFGSALSFGNDVAALRVTFPAEANHFPTRTELADFRGHQS